MSSTQSLSTEDLRDAAREFKLEQDHKRELDHKHKWALGETDESSGRRGDCREGYRRPARSNPQKVQTAIKRCKEPELNKLARMAKKARKHEIQYESSNAPSDSSADEDVVEASAAPEPDADVTYSYDAPHGPRKGSQVLGAALAKAVDKFETKQTEKLVNEEYDVVDDKEDDGLAPLAAVDDDFELL